MVRLAAGVVAEHGVDSDHRADRNKDDADSPPCDEPRTDEHHHHRDGELNDGSGHSLPVSSGGIVSTTLCPPFTAAPCSTMNAADSA